MLEWNSIEMDQKVVCERVGTAWLAVAPNSLVAFNDSLLSSVLPINGLRHPKQVRIDGWYLWSGGEIPDHEDFFKPIHMVHLIEMKPIILKYLGLPAGWRFQIDENGYEDIWFDPTLLVID